MYSTFSAGYRISGWLLMPDVRHPAGYFKWPDIQKINGYRPDNWISGWITGYPAGYWIWLDIRLNHLKNIYCRKSVSELTLYYRINMAFKWWYASLNLSNMGCAPISASILIAFYYYSTNWSYFFASL